MIHKRLIIAAGLLVVAAAIAASLLPDGSHRISPLNACLNNQRQIDGATCQWAADKHRGTNDVPSWEDIRPYLQRSGKILKCPLGGAYALGSAGKPPTCSYPGHTLPP
ncbi:MAG: hypothetical protein NT154_19950 [Verrucomicrobia bacterium]|nr:hypothetical protein [Verrucomicrobiota bacterium]